MTIIVLFSSLVFLFACGIPIVFSIGIASIVTIFITTSNLSIELIPSQMFAGLDSFSLMAIPFFVLMGEIMNETGITNKVVNIANTIVGHVRGGLAYVNVLASMLMAGISGSGAADAAAIGSIMIPAMENDGYDKDFAVSLTATASTMGPIIPPSVLFVLYGFLTNVSVGDLFLGGAVPGALMGLMLMATVYIICLRRNYTQAHGKFSSVKLLAALKQGWAALFVPIIILGGILSGVATATEAAVLTDIFALVLGIFIYRNIHSVKQLKDIFLRAIVTSTVVLLILSVSQLFSNLLVREQFPQFMISFLHSVASTRSEMFGIIILMVLAMGMFVDTTPILVMFAGPLSKVAVSLGIDPIHFGIAMVIAAMIGSVTPPVATLLFIDCNIGGIKMASTFKILWPFILALVLTLVLVMLIPATATFLPTIF